ncbi:uncharacterized protein LOC143246120 [Tachypleus tridentatus]|uniref:uncharacterized protein LOC143246120 n=1 Tax=Tachypleus tridentatus TaxID=6853 RepID=UPI003FD061D3
MIVMKIMDSDAGYQVVETTKEATTTETSRRDVVMQETYEVKMLKQKLAVMEAVLKDTIALIREQTLKANQEIFTLRTQLKKQNELIFSLWCEKGCLLKNLISSLIFLEGKFRKEQKEVIEQLCEKDRLIQETLCELNYWKTRNPGDGKRNYLPTNLTVRQLQEELNIVEKNDCNPFNETTDRLNCKNNESSFKKIPFDLASFTDLHPEKAKCKVSLAKPHLAESTESLEHQFQSKRERCSQDTGSIPGNHQTIEGDSPKTDEPEDNFRRRHVLHGSYERLTGVGKEGSTKQFKKNFNNHRSVIRPRDVKYKNISRSHTRTCQ